MVKANHLIRRMYYYTVAQLEFSIQQTKFQWVRYLIFNQKIQKIQYSKVI